MTNVGKLDFENPLNIPELVEPTVGPDGTKHFTLTMQTGTTEFLPGKKLRHGVLMVPISVRPLGFLVVTK